MPRYASWVRFRGAPASPYVQEVGRKLLGSLIHRLEMGHIRVGKVSRVLEDGTTVIAQYNGTTPIVTVIAGPQVKKLEEELRRVWIPQGFVIEPASDIAPAGWGLPATPDEDTPLEPSPEPTKWTANGPLPDVLLTRASDGGYPNRRQRTRPLYFDPPELSGIVKLPKESTAWTAYRPSFIDIGDDARAVIAALNEERPSEAPLSQPFRGHADLAAWCARLVQSYGSTESDYPIGSNSNAKRVEKDGTVYIREDGAPIGVLGSDDVSGQTTADDVAEKLIEDIPDLGTDTNLKGSTTFSLAGGGAATFVAAIDYRTRWVKCGNLDWFSSINPEIPTISWNGPQGRSIPPRELAFGRRSDSSATSHCFDPVNCVWRLGSSTLIDEMTADFQGRKVPLFDRFVYARGRILAVLPDSGYVLGAAAQKLEATDERPLTYRLVVIGWHRADQFFQGGDDWVGFTRTWDTTSDIRVWYADIPVRNGLALLPQSVIQGAYDEDTNPEGWRQIDRHRLWPLDGDHANHGPGYYVSPVFDPQYTNEAERCAPKTYWQTWFFNASGTEAVCLRAGVWINVAIIQLCGTLGPVQAIKLTVTAEDEPESSLAIAWDLDEAEATDLPYEAYQFSPLYFAWDYRGDDEAKATFSYTGTPGGAGSTHANRTDGASIFTNELNGEVFEVNHEWTLWYFDARSDDYVAVNQTINIEGLSDHVAGVAVHVGVLGEEAAVFTGSVPSSFWLGYSIVGGRGDTEAWSERDEFCGVDHPNPHNMVAFARRGADWVCGFWYGVYPGAYEGTPPDGGPTDSYITVATGMTGSFDVAAAVSVNDGWLNFAGVV